MCLVLQPLRISSAASQSSSSGCVGFAPRNPKSPEVATSPRPKWCCQIQFTYTRAVSGELVLVSQSTSARRVENEFVFDATHNGALPEIISGKPGISLSVGRCTSPRRSTAGIVFFSAAGSYGNGYTPRAGMISILCGLVAGE